MAASASDAHPFPIFGARFRLTIPILDADGDLVTGAASLDTEVSQDGGTFADATNEATEIATSSGVYTLDLISTELDTKCTAGIVKTGTSGAKTTPFVLYPVRLPVIRTGTAQAGGASSVTLDSSASAIDDYYVGCYVNITNNSPSNALGQARKVTAYVGSTKVATVEGTYGTNPSSASTFEVLATEDWIFRFGDTRAFSGTAGAFSGGRPEVNTTHLAGSAVDQSGGLINANVKQISTDATAADNAEAFFDGTGYAGTNNVIPTVTTLTNAPADSSGVTTLLSRIPSGIFTGITSLAQWLGLIAGKQTGNSTARTEVRATGAGSGTFDETTDSQEALRDRGDAAWTTATGFSTHSAADVWAVATRTLTAFDSSFKTGYALSAAGVQAIWDALTSALTTVGSIGKLIVDNINATISSRLATSSYTAPPTAGAIADQVWEETLADHSGTSGSTAAALNAAGSAGDPWTTALPGAYGSGTAGKIIGDNINATVSSRATQTSVDDIPTNAELATSQAAADDATLAAIAALNNLSAAGVRTAVGLATANLDTQLGAIDDFLDTEVAAIKTVVDTIAAAQFTANAGADALLDRSNGIEAGLTLRGALRLIAASSAGKLSGAATSSIVIRNVGDTKDRITATVDADGNRAAVTTDAT